MRFCRTGRTSPKKQDCTAKIRLCGHPIVVVIIENIIVFAASNNYNKHHHHHINCPNEDFN